MTNPNNAIGANAAYGTRTSVNAMNDLAQIVSGRGILSGWAVVPKSGMTVSAGGVAGTRDVAIGEDNLGNKICLNNRLSSSVDVTIPAASASSARYDAIVVYANNPAQADDTTPDAPSVCGIIVASGSASGVSDAQIRSAITDDGGTGSTAYYAVLAQVYVGAGTTTITSANISQSKIDLNLGDGSITTAKIADGAVTTEKIDWTTVESEDITDQLSLNASIMDTSSTPTAELRKVGNLVWLSIPFVRIKVNTTANVWFEVATIPQDLTPVLGTVHAVGAECRNTDGAPLGIFRIGLEETSIRAKAQTSISLTNGYSSVMELSMFWMIS